MEAKGLQGLKSRSYLTNISRIGIVPLDLVEHVVARVAGIVASRTRGPMVASQMLVLAQVHEGHDVASLVEVAAIVGHPHLDARDIDSTGYERKPLAPLIIVVTEEVS